MSKKFNLILSYCILFAMFANSFVFGSVKELNKVTDILNSWSKETHVYVKGNINYDSNALQNIDSWIESNYPNWTVVLVGDSSNEFYKDPEGRNWKGFDAVEYCIGLGLMNQAEFKSIIDKESEMPNACTFMIGFDTRDYGAGPSPLHKKYGITSDNFVSFFGDIVVNRLQDGRRISDAIKDTITAVETRLKNSVDNERIEKEKAASIASAFVDKAKTEITVLKNNLARFKSNYPKINGEIISVDFSGLEANLSNSKMYLGAGNYDAARQEAAKVIKSSSSYLELWNGYLDAGNKIANLEESYVQLSKHEYASYAKDSLAALKESINLAKSSWQNGELKYLSLIDLTQDNLKNAQAKIEHEKSVSAMISFLKKAVVLLFAVVVLLISFIANKIRKPAKEKSQKLIFDWQKALNEKMNALLEVYNPSQSIFSSRTSVSVFKGQSALIAQNLGKNIGSLFIMHARAKEMLDKAKLLAYPKSLFACILNFFSSKNYLLAASLLKDKPIEFDENSDIYFVVLGEKKKPEEVLYAPLNSFEAFKLSFDELINTFDSTAKSVVEDLNKILDAQTQVVSLLENTRKELSATKNLYITMDNLSINEGLELPDCPESLEQFESLINNINVLSFDDPVLAFSHSQDIASRISICKNIISALINSLQESKVKILEATQKLNSSNIQIPWAMQDLAKIFNDANDFIMHITKSEKIPSAPFNVSLAISRLVESVFSALSISKDFNKLTVKIADSSKLVLELRTQISSGLVKCPQELFKSGINVNVLAEKDSNPIDFLNQANGFLSSAKNAISLSDLALAKSAIDNAYMLVDSADKIINKTKIEFNAFNELLNHLQEQNKELRINLNNAKNVLEKMSATYPPKALLFGKGDKTHPRANQTVADNILEIESAINNWEILVSKANELYSCGKILEAYSLLENANLENVFIVDRIAEINEKQQLIEKTLESNKNLISILENDLEGLALMCAGSKVLENTSKRCSIAIEILESIKSAVKTPMSDPFAIEEEINKLFIEAKSIENQIEKDNKEYDEAKKSTVTCSQIISECQFELDKARSDDIPDSSIINNASEKIISLCRKLDSIQENFLPSCVNANWYQIDDLADKLASEAQELLASLRKEIVEGKNAAKAISNAKEQIHELNNWNNSEGVSIDRSAGSSSLKKALELVMLGNYAQAVLDANNAKKESLAEIERADAKVRSIKHQRQLDEERRARERRRAQEQRRSQQSSYSYSSSHRSSSFSSSSSGISRSSFGGSSSGIGRGKF
ncbi:MAG: hypothetical protein ACP5OG_02115 [Candidatus Nanoarchaeia archaeon]